MSRGNLTPQPQLAPSYAWADAAPLPGNLIAPYLTAAMGIGGTTTVAPQPLYPTLPMLTAAGV